MFLKLEFSVELKGFPQNVLNFKMCELLPSLKLVSQINIE